MRVFSWKMSLKLMWGDQINHFFGKESPLWWSNPDHAVLRQSDVSFSSKTICMNTSTSLQKAHCPNNSQKFPKAITEWTFISWYSVICHWCSRFNCWEWRSVLAKNKHYLNILYLCCAECGEKKKVCELNLANPGNQIQSANAVRTQLSVYHSWTYSHCFDDWLHIVAFCSCSFD